MTSIEGACNGTSSEACTSPKSKVRKLNHGNTDVNKIENPSSNTEANGEQPTNSTPLETVKDFTSADYYADSYSHFGIHEEMLKDHIRTNSYKHAIERNAHLIRGKVVLDVGCGTGILSLFCAKAGAKKVIGIDCSTIIIHARKIVADNGYADVITLVQSKCEDLTELPDGIEKVDVIISEWMGYFLLYESMLDTVIYCRDRWLKPGGLILPDKAELKLCAIEDESYRNEKIEYWTDVYGFDFKAIKDLALLEPLVDVVEKDAIVTDSVTFLSLDLNTCKVADLKFTCDVLMTCHRKDKVHALCAYFDMYFTNLRSPISFSTGPAAHYTHWKQTIFYLSGDGVKVDVGSQIRAQMSVCPNDKNPRDLDITLTTDIKAFKDTSYTQEFRLR